MVVDGGIDPVNKENVVKYNQIAFDPDFLKSLIKCTTVYSDGKRDYVIKDIAIPHPEDKEGKLTAILKHLGFNELGFDFPVHVDLVEFLTHYKPLRGCLPYKWETQCELCKGNKS